MSNEVNERLDSLQEAYRELGRRIEKEKKRISTAREGMSSSGVIAVTSDLSARAETTMNGLRRCSPGHVAYNRGWADGVCYAVSSLMSLESENYLRVLLQERQELLDGNPLFRDMILAESEGEL